MREQIPEDRVAYYNLYAETSILAKRMSSTVFKDFLKNSGNKEKKKMYRLKQGVDQIVWEYGGTSQVANYVMTSGKKYWRKS